MTKQQDSSPNGPWVGETESTQAPAHCTSGEFPPADRDQDYPTPAPAEEATAESQGPKPTEDDARDRLRDQLQRLHAEFDNYRKRVNREREDWSRRARADVYGRMLPILDDADRAHAHEASGRPLNPEGLSLILRRLDDVLSAAGVARMVTPPGTEFDPSRHDAVMVVASAEVPEGAIVEVLEAGWTFDDQVLRPAKVSVSRGSSEA